MTQQTASTTISTANGDYLIWQADEDMRHPDGDIQAGDWLYQPADWQGDLYSPSYATQAEAEAAAHGDAHERTADAE